MFIYNKLKRSYSVNNMSLERTNLPIAINFQQILGLLFHVN